MSIIEVDTIDIMTSLIEENNAIAILPQKTITMNSKLDILSELNCDCLSIYVYALKSNAKNFTITLSPSD